MLSEGQWQSQLISSTQKDHGGWGIRMSALQRYGCPDLLIQLPHFPTLLIETKVVQVPDIETKGGSVTIAATPLQRETLRAIRMAGGKVGFWILVNDRLTLVGIDPFQEYLKIGECEHMLRERGRPWPIPALVARTITAGA